MRHPACVVGITLLLAAGGCGLPNRQQEAKAAAKKRFNHQKAKIKYVLGLEQFENGLIDNAAKSIQEAISIYDLNKRHNPNCSRGQGSEDHSSSGDTVNYENFWRTTSLSSGKNSKGRDQESSYHDSNQTEM